MGAGTHNIKAMSVNAQMINSQCIDAQCIKRWVWRPNT